MDFKEIGEVLGRRGDCQSCPKRDVRLWKISFDWGPLEVCGECVNHYREISKRDKKRKGS